jgi:hypothetical protein
MPATTPLFHTATFNHRVPGEQLDLAAVSYNLQYTKDVVAAFAERNPPSETDIEVVRLRDRELTRATLFGLHPYDESRRICTIGVGDGEDRALRSAGNAWFDYHASKLFADKVGLDRTFTVSIRRPVPGAPARRARTVGVYYELSFMDSVVEAAVTRNRPKKDDLQVVEASDLTLMRVNLFGSHPLETSRRICVGGIADRHYRAVAAAEQAWTRYHMTLLFGAEALVSV